jgi:hypothetical protein
MNTCVLAQMKSGEVVTCAGPLIETDIPSLFTDNPSYKDEFEVFDETFFKLIHPEEYKDLVQSDVTMAISVWLEKKYDGAKDIAIEDNVIGTNTFFIVVDECTLYLHLLFGCTHIEAVEIGVLLHEKLPEYTLLVKNATVFAKVLEN